MVDFDILKEVVKAEFASKKKFIPLNMAALEEGKKAADKCKTQNASAGGLS
jgi:hypothetical protein